MRGRICGTGSYIPEHYYDNNDLAKFVETNDEWIRERTGIVRRHIAEEDTTVSMAVKAAKNALTDAKLNSRRSGSDPGIYNHAKHRDPKHCLRSPRKSWEQ